MPVQIVKRGNAERSLQKMPIKLRQKSLKKALRRGGNEQAKAARRLAPKPGYPGDKPGKLALNKSIRTIVKEYYRGPIVAVVGPRWPEGAHGFLVEYGHNITRKTPGISFARPRPFMREAYETTQRKQHAVIVLSLRKDVTMFREP